MERGQKCSLIISKRLIGMPYSSNVRAVVIISFGSLIIESSVDWSGSFFARKPNNGIMLQKKQRCIFNLNFIANSLLAADV